MMGSVKSGLEICSHFECLSDEQSVYQIVLLIYLHSNGLRDAEILSLMPLKCRAVCKTL